MTKTNTKGVPRSRLNITYRTHVEGREVKKELPLRLLVAGDFSGRRKDKTPELPLLDRRLMYAIGKAGSLESMLKVMRVGLPVPADLTHECEFEVNGSANVRVTRGGDGVLIVTQLEDGRVTGQAVRDGAKKGDSSDSSDADAKKEDGAEGEEGAQAASTAEATAATPSASRVGSNVRYEGRIKLSSLELNKDLIEGSLEIPTEGVVASAWLVPTKQPPREAPIMYQATKISKLELTFEEPLVGMDVPREGLDRRVRLSAEITARQVVPLLDMKSFEPRRIAESVPEIRRLLVLRWLVSQGRSMIASNPVLRGKCKELLKSQGNAEGESAATSPLQELKEKLGELNKHRVFDLEKQW